MRSEVKPLVRNQVRSNKALWLSSIGAGVAVFGLALWLQWLIYDDWMHWKGPLRMVGSAVAGVLTALFTHRWQRVARQREMERRRRLEAIQRVNDQVRNSLQAIECVTYAHDPQTTYHVRTAIDAIEQTLQEALPDAHTALPFTLTDSNRDNSSARWHDRQR